MSTKIYNAYKFTGTLFELMQELKKIRHGHRENTNERIQKIYVGMNVEAGKTVSVGDMMSLVQKANVSKDSSPLDITADAVIYPRPGYFLVQFFRVACPIGKPFTDYHYQNQTDKPEEVTEEEWEEREKEWDEVFQDSWAPSETGLVYEMYSNDFPLWRILQSEWLKLPVQVDK